MNRNLKYVVYESVQFWVYNNNLNSKPKITHIISIDILMIAIVSK